MLRKTRLRKVVVQGETGYNLTTEKGTTSYEGKLQPWRHKSKHIPVGVPVKAEKLTDAAKLLNKHFQSDWRHLEAL